MENVQIAYYNDENVDRIRHLAPTLGSQQEEYIIWGTDASLIRRLSDELSESMFKIKTLSNDMSETFFIAVTD